MIEAEWKKIARRSPNCGKCSHFDVAEFYRYEFWPIKGWCRFSPEPVKINHPNWHICGQFTEGPTALRDAKGNQAMRERRRGQTDQATRAIGAEKKLKAVRKELRELKKVLATS